MDAKFTQIHAAADYIGPGAIEVPMYQSEILDIVRRRGVFGQRIKQVPATGHPSRYFEERAIPSPAASSGFVDPRNIVAPLVSPTRVEMSVPLKALVADQLQPLRHGAGPAAVAVRLPAGQRPR